ncbi:hypothetical protein RKLH11_1916 [Rhodobacteraceae bacterium KLH11]|nr:hypothetical protein RKLH11_1916 [Rhodobacteraceae bacterium KLH11]
MTERQFFWTPRALPECPEPVYSLDWRRVFLPCLALVFWSFALV